jgi:predicted alpha-1,6-mannanase (GH76 family)
MKTTKWILVVLSLALVPILITSGPSTRAFASGDADTAMNAFVSAYWDPSLKYFYTNSDHLVHSEHAFGPQNGLYSDFWWEAQLWEVVMDAYKRTSSATYRQMIDDVYNGFAAQYPSFADGFNDDAGWWALASARAYEITGNTAYRDKAVSLFNGIWAYWDSTYGGGVWWKTTVQDEKNMATNAPLVITAIKLKNATGDATYLTKAQNAYSWIKSTLTDANGHVYDHISGAAPGTVAKWDFTYNFGTFAGAAAALYGATSTAGYLTDATNAANWAINNLNSGGTLLRESSSDPPNDTGGFKMIFVRYVNQLVTQYGQTQLLPFLQRNATQAWNHRRGSDNLVGPDWSDNTPTSWLQSLSSSAAADVLQVVSPDNYSGLLPENGWYEAENGVIHNIGSESINAGFTGRGYLAGWNGNGQWVDFRVNAPTTGVYELKLRYAAGAGNASRQIYVNAATVVGNFAFPSTGSWGSWNTAVLDGVNLNQGTNTVSVIFCSSCGSTNYLNLDNVQISVQLQAENGTLRGGIFVEATNAGYSGTGYVAGWNANSQWVDLTVSVSKSGPYAMYFRYAAGAGNASRYLYVNGVGVVNNLAFPGTGAWTSYGTVTVSNVQLNAGSNTISLIFDSSRGSANWLNYDELTLRYTP